MSAEEFGHKAATYLWTAAERTVRTMSVLFWHAFVFWILGFLCAYASMRDRMGLFVFILLLGVLFGAGVQTLIEHFQNRTVRLAVEDERIATAAWLRSWGLMDHANRLEAGEQHED